MIGEKDTVAERSLQLQMDPQTIVVLRALQLGDLLCAVPAFRSLRTAFPKTHIALIGLPWAETFVGRFARYLDEFIEFPGYPGLPERPVAVSAVPTFLLAMQRRRFDLALQMHGNGRHTNQLLALLDARTAAGFVCGEDYCPDERRFMPYPDHLPEADRHLALLRRLGIPAHDHRLEFPLNMEDINAFRKLQSTHGLQPVSYVCLHPGGRGLSRRWPPHLFSLVADRLVKSGYRIVITGTEQERPLVQAVMAHMREEATNLAGQTDLGTLGVLLTQSALLIANDTGVSHLAAALHVPSVIVCIGSDPVRWSPSDNRLHRVLVGQDTTVDEVMEAAHALERARSRPHGKRGAVPHREYAAPDISPTPRQEIKSQPSGPIRSL